MSRGLGHLQREIMATLAARSGGDELEDYRGYRAWIADGAHDLRAVTREMARRMGGSNRHGFINIAWQASFSRAVAGLVSRELIEILWLERFQFIPVHIQRRRSSFCTRLGRTRRGFGRWFPKAHGWFGRRLFGGLP